MLSSKNLPIMPALCNLCSKLAYYAGIMLDALACLLCLKLCWHNRRMPISHMTREKDILTNYQRFAEGQKVSLGDRTVDV